MFKEIENLNRSIFLAINAKPGAPDSALKIAFLFRQYSYLCHTDYYFTFMVCQ
jgi:hypothetical protein